MPVGASARHAGLIADRLRLPAAPEMPARHEQAMSVLLQPAIAHLGKAEHPLDDSDGMLDPGPHFGLGAVFRPLDLIHDTAVAVASIGEIPGLGRIPLITDRWPRYV